MTNHDSLQAETWRNGDSHCEDRSQSGTVEYKNLCFATRSAGGQDKIQPRRRQYYRRVHSLVYAVDSNDRHRIEEANEELIKVPNED